MATLLSSTPRLHYRALAPGLARLSSFFRDATLFSCRQSGSLLPVSGSLLGSWNSVLQCFSYSQGGSAAHGMIRPSLGFLGLAVSRVDPESSHDSLLVSICPGRSHRKGSRTALTKSIPVMRDSQADPSNVNSQKPICSMLRTLWSTVATFIVLLPNAPHPNATARALVSAWSPCEPRSQFTEMDCRSSSHRLSPR
jgi:hypothetical protein